MPPEENGFLTVAAAYGRTMGEHGGPARRGMKKAGSPKATGRHFHCDMDALINPP